ncbi:MAG: aldo/keto reductase [Acidobacteriaceae bacterium]|nr:aldo/keto reductase [Acidobacteriaceae bacterium]
MLTPHLTTQALPVGFGCAHLQYLSQSRPGSLRLLEEAFDHGITHFDVARLYSAGEAEGVVGQFARGRRDRIVLVSKAGIFPLRQTFYHRLDRKIRTVAKAKAPKLSRWIADAVHEPLFNKFSPKDIRSSVEKSLRELRTDYLDALLLHECRAVDVAFFDVPTTLDKLRAEGKILSYGLATSVEQSAAITQSFPKLASVVQIPGRSFNAQAWPFLSEQGRLVITHSILTESLRPLMILLGRHPAIRQAIQSKLGFDLSAAPDLAQFLMIRALKANPSGLVLFSTAKPEHIRRCVEAAKVAKCPDSHERVIECLRLVEDVA